MVVGEAQAAAVFGGEGDGVVRGGSGYGGGGGRGGGGVRGGDEGSCSAMAAVDFKRLTGAAVSQPGTPRTQAARYQKKDDLAAAATPLPTAADDPADPRDVDLGT